MDEVKKLFHKKTSQKELGDNSSPDNTTSRWRRRSQSRGRTSSGQKSKDLESSPYDAQPEGGVPTQGAEPVHGNAGSAARPRDSFKQAPEVPHPFPAPSSGNIASPNPARPTSGVISSGHQDGPTPKTPNNWDSYQQPATEQRSPTLPIAEQFSQSAYYDRSSNEMSRANIPSVAAQTRRRDLPIRTTNTGSTVDQTSQSMPMSTADRHNHPTGPRTQPNRTNPSPTTNGPDSIEIPKRDVGGSSNVNGIGYSGVAGGSRQLSTGSIANGTIQKGPYTKRGTASAAPPTNSTITSGKNYDSGSNYSAAGKRYLVEGASEPPSLEGIVDLRNTTKTTVHTTWATPVIHERIMPKIHHITHPAIERRIHNHDVHHRVLPVIDVQVLPAKHYAPHGPNGSLIEIGSAELPGRMGANQHWVVAETVSKLGGEDQNVSQQYAPREFTARPYAVSNGEPKAYTNAKGIPTTEQTWIHSPSMHEGARLTNQTEALHFGEDRGDGVFHERPGMQSRREKDAEDVVAADSARRGGDGLGARSQANDIAHLQKPKPQRELEAERAIVGGQYQGRGAFGHRGM